MTIIGGAGGQILLAVTMGALGVAIWTGTEYGAHRFAMHSVNGRGPAAKEHLMHHAQPERSRRFIRLLGHLGMYATAVVFGIALSFVFPLVVAVPVAVGWGLGYTLYEGLHWAAHHRPPINTFDLRLRRRHFHHHFAAPKSNLGVVFAGWDVLLGTNVEPDVIKVPRRLAMPWLTDADGNVLPEFADDYVIVGRAERNVAQDERDRVAAFADQPPPLN